MVDYLRCKMSGGMFVKFVLDFVDSFALFVGFDVVLRCGKYAEKSYESNGPRFEYVGH